ncbi:MAG: diguanylate cyclase [Xenococcaceae cyanobacterium MO_167.B52]|nr:diguanylate cyclase [Xenococcaceae cyanobacterium MO_167.B52]
MKKNFHLSLHHILIISFVSQVLIAVGLTSYFSWKNGQKTVEAMAMRLSREVTSHTQQHINDYLKIPTLFLKINRIFAQYKYLNIDNNQELRNVFWREAQIDPKIDTIYFGSETGDFIEIELKNPPKIYLRTSATAPYWEIYRLNEEGQKTDKIERKKYDPRERPWYRAAIEQKKLTWSPIYLFTDPPVLGITPAIPLFDSKTGNPQGVMAIDLTLEDISEFLSSLKISSSGRVFIIEKSGEIIATSTGNPVVIETKNGNKRLNYQNSKDDLIHNTAQFLSQKFNDFNSIDEQQQLIFKLNRDRYFIQIHTLNNHPGLDWLIITVIPESDFMEHIWTNMYTTLTLSSLAAISAVGLGAIANKWIAKSVTRLSQMAKSLANGTINQIEIQSKIEELDIFTQYFNSMALRLQTSMESLEAADLRCEQEIAKRTKFLQQTNQELNRLAHTDSLTQIYNRYHFDIVLEQIWQQAIRDRQEIAILLFDVDYFKLYNDTYGHPAGDECLKKVATAISNALNRGQDIAARYGGEEFAVILPNTKVAGAFLVAERIKEAIAELRIIHETSAIENYVTVSCGVASLLASNAFKATDLVSRADRALYQAKLLGRNCIFIGS